MKEHPIPQDITNYRFHIIGSMTLKQFLEIGAGVVFAAIMYKTGFPAFIKWPIIVFSAGLGAAAAFLPIEERPLDHWITTYFRVLFKPTQFFWRREPKIPPIFTYTPNASSQQATAEVDLTPLKRQRIKDYMASLHQPNTVVDPLDAQQQSRINEIVDSFNSVEVTQQQSVTTKVEKPTLTPRIRVLRKPDEEDTNPTPNFSEFAKMVDVPIIHPNTPSESAAGLTQVVLPDAKIVEAPNTRLDPTQVAQAVRIVDTPLIQVSEEKREETHNTAPIKNLTKEQLNQMLQPTPTSSPEQVTAQSSATFNTNLPFPSMPSEPNKLVGMVLTANGELVPGAVVEVHNQQGTIERVVKSNALGQFFITTPLKPGNYVVEVESDNLAFPPVGLTVNNSPLKPMELRAS